MKNEINKTRHIKKHLFESEYQERMEQYIKFMDRNIMNEKFYKLMNKYYPDKLLTVNRIKNVIKKYIFDIDDTNPTHKNIYLFRPKIENTTIIPDTSLDVHKCINYLTKKFTNMYLLNNSSNINNENNQVMYDYTDLTKIINYRSSFRYYYYLILRVKYTLIMYYNGFRVSNISKSNIKIWSNQKILMNNNDKNKILNIVLLDDDCIKKIKLNDIDRNNIYIEINGFSSYGDFTDMIKYCFSNIENMESIKQLTDELIKSLRQLLEKCNRDKLEIYMAGRTTIITPYLMREQMEEINKYHIHNPVYYPVGNYKLFESMKYDLINNMELFGLRHWIMFHRLTLFDIYFISDLDNKLNELNEELNSDIIDITFGQSKNKFVDKYMINLIQSGYINNDNN